MSITVDDANALPSDSQEQVLAEIRDRWANYGQFDANRVKLEFEQGAVILRGVVESRHVKHIAEDMALAVPGVKRVHNYLKIDPSPQRPVSQETELKEPEEYRRETSIESRYPGYDPYLDQYSAPETSYSEFSTPLPNSDAELDQEEESGSNGAIAAEINQRLRQQGQLKKGNISVVVNSGQVILKGIVDNPQAKQLADEIARSIAGVSQVLNQLHVQAAG